MAGSGRAVETSPSRRGGRQPRFTQSMVFEAALRIIDRDGVEALSMRRLAEEMGVGVMTLYGYVRTKEEVLDGATALALSALVVDIHPDQAWDDALTAVLIALHASLREHPGALQLALAPHSMSVGGANDIRESLLRLLLGAGFAPGDAVEAIGMLTAYVFGFTGLQAARFRLETPAEQAAALTRLDARRYPFLREAATAWADRSADATFRRGLDLLINGLREQLADRPPADRTPSSRSRRKGTP